MSKRIKRSVMVVQSRAEVEVLVHDIAASMNRAASLKAAMDKEVLAVQKRYGAGLEKIEQSIAPMMDAVKGWAEANEAEFGKRKSIDFVSAVIGFRTGMPKLVLLNRQWNWNTATDAVRSHLPNFIRDKPEIDKEAIISQSAELTTILPQCGVKVTQGESFYIEPKLTKVETVQKAEAA